MAHCRTRMGQLLQLIPRHVFDHPAVAAGGDVVHQDFQEPGAHAVLHGLVGRDIHLPARPSALTGQPGLRNPQLAVRKADFALWGAMPANVAPLRPWCFPPATPAADNCKTASMRARPRTSINSSTAMREASIISTTGGSSCPFLSKFRAKPWLSFRFTIWSDGLMAVPPYP